LSKVDTEILFLKLKQFVQSNIGAVVTAINTEKDDSTVLAAPEAKAYIDLSFDSAVINYDPFVFTFIDSISSQIAGPNIEKSIRFEVCIFKARTGKPDEHILGLRYMRVMEELAELAWEKVFKSYRYEVETLTPVEVQLANQTKWHRVYGVALTVSLS